MKRADTTERDYQMAYRGPHRFTNGVWGYPRKGNHGSRYLRCTCGWRLVGVKRTPKGRARSAQLSREHLADVRQAMKEATS